MIEFNYPELIQDIKVALFTGDLSGIYSLARGVACIATSWGIVSWYNRMMNEPYGRLDMAAVVRAVFILILTCNFYSTVLMPLDGITHMVAKGLTAFADGDREGLMGRVNEVYERAEDARKRESLTGAFEDEVEGASSATEVEGLSYQSSAITESLVQAELNGGASEPKWYERLWTGMKGFVRARVGIAVSDVGCVVSALISVVVKLAQYVLLAMSSIYLIVLGLLGPFVFAFSLMPGFESNILGWLARYIQISFWIPLTAFLDMVNVKLKGAMLAAMLNAPFVSALAAPYHLIVLDVVLLLCLLGVPQMAGWVIQSSGADDLTRKMATMGKKALSMVIK